MDDTASSVASAKSSCISAKKAPPDGVGGDTDEKVDGGLKAPNIMILNKAIKYKVLLRSKNIDHPVATITNYALERKGFDFNHDSSSIKKRSTYLLFCTRKYCDFATTNLLCARGRIKISQKKIRRNNLIMVSTRRSPQKTRPTGVPTLRDQARVRAERAEQREQRSAAAQANAPPVEEAHRPIEEEEASQLDIVDDDDVVYHGNDKDEEECVGSDTMADVDDDEEEQKVVDDEEEGQGGGDVFLGTVVLARKSKLALKDTVSRTLTLVCPFLTQPYALCVGQRIPS